MENVVRDTAAPPDALSDFDRGLIGSHLNYIGSLLNLVQGRLTFGWNPKPIRHDGTAPDILRKSAEGAKFVCGTFTRLFIEVCAAAGLTAREVILIRRGMETVDPNNFEAWFARHRIVEVSLDIPQGAFRPQPTRLRVWAAVDPTWGLMYRDPVNGHPLNALQLQHRWASDHIGRIGTSRHGALPAIEVPREPAYVNFPGKGWGPHIPAEVVVSINERLLEQDNLPYYDYLFFPDRNYVGYQTLAVAHPRLGRIDRHWNAPLEKAVGPYRYLDNPKELYRYDFDL